MIRIKLTPQGGYVLGDGECPFAPDSFMKAFAHKIMQAQLRGLEEIGITDEEVAEYLQKADDNFSKSLDEAEVVEVKEYKQPKTTQKHIFDVIDAYDI